MLTDCLKIKLRLLLFMTFLVFAVIPIHSQELSVKSFCLANKDLSASLYPRKDSNGNVCALIKIYVNYDISRVEGNVIGSIDNHGMEKWVYLSSGSKMMKVIPANHIPIFVTFSDFNYRAVESKHTYELVLVEKTETASNGIMKWSQIDSISYTGGMALTNGLDAFLKEQQKIKDGISNKEFQSALKEYLNNYDKPTEQARLAGWEIVDQLKSKILPGQQHEVDSLGGVYRIDDPIYYEGVIDCLKGKYLRFTKDSAKDYYEKHKRDSKAEDSQAFCYAAGMMIANGLKEYLLKEGRITEGTMKNFILGLEEAAETQKNEGGKPIVAGYSIGYQVISRMLPGVQKEIQNLKTDLFLDGFFSGITGDDKRFSVESAEKYFKSKQAAIKDKKLREIRQPNERFLIENKKKPGVVTTTSGLQYKVLRKGTGRIPTQTDKVRVDYEGRLIDGTIFDSSKQHSDKGATFRPDQVIKGWTEALTMMQEGSKWEVYIPENLGYGEREVGKIPPCSTLIFTIELIGIE